MDDFLIQQLPAPLLRSALRALIAQGTSAQRTFVEHVRNALRQPKKEFPPADRLLGPSADKFPDEFWSEARCLFSSKMVEESLPYLSHLTKSIPRSRAVWNPASSFERKLDHACGDIVQAVQALKESAPQPTEQLQELLLDLQSSIEECRAYCLRSGMVCPFNRARFQVADALNFLFPQIPSQPEGVECLPLVHVRPTPPSISSSVEYVQLGAIRVPRLFNGLWQMSSPAWGSASSDRQDSALAEAVEHGLVATDMADHYGDAELIYGSFRNRLADQAVAGNVIAATKWCIFRPLNQPVTHEFVLEAVQERYRRLGGRVELLQFHWYDYSVKEYLLVLAELVKITKTHPHLVSQIGLCNFDSEHTQEACEYLLATLGEVGIVSNQVQYSLIDCRPLMKMASVCKRYNIKLLTYGSFCGGFLSDKWLGKKLPNIYCPSFGLTPSQRKYFDMVNQWGSWNELQSLLRLLKTVADAHAVDISNVASRWVLDHEEVGSVIVGTRLGVSSNVQSNMKAFTFRLTDEERKAIDDFVCGVRASSLFEKIGDCGHEYQKH
ncbi:aldo-keto reductase [Flagelloscypha sp. PMI_526]|nr:aldo-keto reductase [Flagelloscypha sp. PMI_526]